jgi:hypothetical protein
MFLENHHNDLEKLSQWFTEGIAITFLTNKHIFVDWMTGLCYFAFRLLLATTFHLPPSTENLFPEREGGWNVLLSPAVVSSHRFTEDERTRPG